MNNNEQTSSEELRIQGLLDRYLRFRSTAANSAPHLDEDSLNAFVEGRLSRLEASPVIKHLIDCSFCLNVTAELVKLEFAFADEATTDFASPAAEPTKVSDVLNGLLARIFGSGGDAVFAHQENDETETDEKEVEKER